MTLRVSLLRSMIMKEFRVPGSLPLCSWVAVWSTVWVPESREPGGLGSICFISAYGGGVGLSVVSLVTLEVFVTVRTAFWVTVVVGGCVEES